jgi:hypothetical protein
MAKPTARTRDLWGVIYGAIAYREWGPDIFDHIGVIEGHVVVLLRKRDPRLTNQEVELITADLSAEMIEAVEGLFSLGSRRNRHCRSGGSR